MRDSRGCIRSSSARCIRGLRGSFQELWRLSTLCVVGSGGGAARSLGGHGARKQGRADGVAVPRTADGRRRNQ